MNIRAIFFIVFFSFTNFTYLISSESQYLTPKNSTALTLGTSYTLPTLPAQDNTFNPPKEAEKCLSNLWGLLIPSKPAEKPEEHVLKIVVSGQMHDACRLASTALDTKDPKFLDMLALITGEEFNKLRITNQENIGQALRLLEENRKRMETIISNTNLLVEAIQSSATTKPLLTAERIHLFSQAVAQTRDKQTEFFALITKEHAALVATLEKIKEKLENK